MSNVFQVFVSKVEAYFTRGKAKEAVQKIDAALADVAHIIPYALPIVEDIAALTPNKTVQEAEQVVAKYIAPAAIEINNDPSSIGNVLLNVATTAVQKNLPKGDVAPATHLIQTAVQLAVAAVNAGK